MARRWSRLAILAKIQPVAGTDPVPTGAANAIQAIDVTLTPFAGEEVSRGYMLPYLGHRGVLFVGNYVTLQFSVELAGSGAAGTPPAYGPLLRASGMAEVITEDTSVAYNPISDDYEMLALYANLDGVNHALLGARGTFTLAIVPKQVPRITFTFSGLLGPVADVALPAGDYTDWVKAIPVSKVNTPVLTVHGVSAPTESLNLDIANSVIVRNLVNYEGVEISDRQATGSAVLQAGSIATKNWIATAAAHTLGAVAVQHGTAAGNIVDLALPAVQIGRPTYGNTDNITNNTLPMMITPVVGNDELVITVR